MHIDYADVLAQAVENERWRVLRSVAEAVQRVAVTRASRSRSYGLEDITGAEVKREILIAVRRIEAEGK
jgi:phosphosulfolactate phosphohydrolase-like enzyme